MKRFNNKKKFTTLEGLYESMHANANTMGDGSGDLKKSQKVGGSAPQQAGGDKDFFDKGKAFKKGLRKSGPEGAENIDTPDENGLGDHDSVSQGHPEALGKEGGHKNTQGLTPDGDGSTKQGKSADFFSSSDNAKKFNSNTGPENADQFSKKIVGDSFKALYDRIVKEEFGDYEGGLDTSMNSGGDLGPGQKAISMGGDDEDEFGEEDEETSNLKDSFLSLCKVLKAKGVDCVELIKSEYEDEEGEDGEGEIDPEFSDESELGSDSEFQ